MILLLGELFAEENNFFSFFFFESIYDFVISFKYNVGTSSLVGLDSLLLLVRWDGLNRSKLIDDGLKQLEVFVSFTFVVVVTLLTCLRLIFILLDLI